MSNLIVIVLTTGQTSWKAWRKAASHGGGQIFQRGQCNLTPVSQEHCSWLQQSRCHAIIGDSVILFAAYTTAETRCFSLGQTTPNW